MKTIVVFSVVITILFCNSAVSAQMPIWYSQIKQIKVLKDAREDVIKIFGEPNNSNSKYDASYKYEDYRLDIEFSHGLCETTKEEGWNIPEFVVTDIFVQLYKKINYRKLNLKLKKLDREEIFDVPKSYVYHDYEKGESYSIDSKGILDSVSLEPKKEENYLFCEKPSDTVKVVYKKYER